MADRVLPIPPLRQVRNSTPFPNLQFDKMGKGRRFHDVIVVCASFELAPGHLQPCSTHRGPVLADEPWESGQAEFSSLRKATDLLLTKPGADVYVTGTARSLEERPHRDWYCMLQMKRAERIILDKRLRLTGPRRWHRGIMGRRLTSPGATRAVPLRYELAYGGWWHNRGDASDKPASVYASNPSGTGWFGSATQDHDLRARYREDRDIAGPQIEYLGTPIRAANRRYRTAGLAPIARHWKPRSDYAGTYDHAWTKQFERETIPDYPADFDNRFFQYAPADQIVAEGLQGDETLQLAGFFADTPAMTIRLPRIGLEAECHDHAGREHVRNMSLDTIHIDLDAARVHLTWRLTLDQTQRIVGAEISCRQNGSSNHRPSVSHAA